jgi:hypothetical protein
MARLRDSLRPAGGGATPRDENPRPSVVTFGFDVLVTRGDFEAVKAALESVGFVHSFSFGIDIFVDGPDGKACEVMHILFAAERVKPQDPVATPDLGGTETFDGESTGTSPC